jgi:PAS domain-containing protein
MDPSEVAMRRDDRKKRAAQKTAAEQESLLWYFERMDKVNRAMQGTNDLEQAMKDVLDTLLDVFKCDRAWLVYPCDPESPTWQVSMERTTPEYPSVLPIGVELPLDPVGADVYRKLRNTEGPVKFGPDFEDQVPTVIAQAFQVRSFVAMAFYPKIGKPWSFGLHQCSYARAWTPEEERLFQEIGRRLSDTLSTLLAYRNLQENEAQIRQLVDFSPVAMAVTSRVDGRAELLNDKFIELFGYTIEDAPAWSTGGPWLIQIKPIARQSEESGRQGLNEHFRTRLPSNHWRQPSSARMVRAATLSFVFPPSAKNISSHLLTSPNASRRRRRYANVNAILNPCCAFPANWNRRKHIQTF